MIRSLIKETTYNLFLYFNLSIRFDISDNQLLNAEINYLETTHIWFILLNWMPCLASSFHPALLQYNLHRSFPLVKDPRRARSDPGQVSPSLALAPTGSENR